MQTDDLIQILSQSPRSKAPTSLMTALGAILVVNFFITINALGVRPDLASVTADFTALHKTILLLSVLLTAAWALKNAAKPVTQQSWVMVLPWFLPVLFGVSILMEWLDHTPQEIIASFYLPNFPVCLAAVSFYGILGSIILTWLMRLYAPVNFRKTGFIIGLAAAAAGALGYSVHCPIDSPTFITVAYGLPVLAISLATRLIAPRFIKW